MKAVEGVVVVLRSVLSCAALALVGIVPAAAQVRYERHLAGAPTTGVYPVPGGILQPDEVLGTSPTYVINPSARYGEPVVSVTQRCQYPDGWNVTDFNRDIGGIPSGIDHVCPDARVRSRY